MLKHILEHGEPGSVLTHGIGAILSIFALAALLIIAYLYGNIWHLSTFTVFGISLVLLYLASTIYHAVPKYHAAKKIMQKLDRSMIFVLIAGTYTPICLTVLRGSLGWSLFAAVWTMAAIGILLKLTLKKFPSWISTIFYLAMGWLGLIALMPLWQALPFTALAWLVGGGILYTLGIVFFALEYFVGQRRWLGMHEIFHLFVIGGSFSHVWFTAAHLITA